MQNTFKIAYIILCHKNPAQVARLVSRLYYPCCHLFIHVDKRVAARPFVENFSLAVPPACLTYIKNRVVCRWGDFSVTQASLNALNEAYTSDFQADLYVLLSGQDYPLVSTTVMLDWFEQHAGDSYLFHHGIDPQLNPYLTERLTAYTLLHRPNRQISYPYKGNSARQKLLSRLVKVSGLFPLPRVVPGGLTPYFGSNWLRLAPDALDYLLRAVKANPSLKRYFRWSLVPEEFLFHTVLMNGPDSIRQRIQNTSLTFTHWDRPLELYPTPLTKSDFPALMNSGCFYGRKFDIDHDSEVLDWIDQKIGFIK
jgi:hypothetical protein